MTNNDVSLDQLINLSDKENEDRMVEPDTGTSQSNLNTVREYISVK